MKRTRKTILAVLTLSATALIAAGLSACSIVLPVIEGENNQTPAPEGPGGGGTTGAETYTMDVAQFDAYWYDNVVDTALWKTTGSVGAYAKNTLVLNADGTYELTKEMGAAQAAIDRWSTDGGVNDNNFNIYTYYGTYEKSADGKTVTLSECTSIAAEVDIFDMSAGYDLGNYSIDYTKTDDLTFKAGCTGDQTVVDLMYGPYIADSGYGNCSQVVSLGTYDYGTFTFEGLAEEGGDDDGGEEQPVPEKPGYQFTAAEEGMRLVVHTDGTYTFFYGEDSESGAYSWNRLTQTLVLTPPEGADTVAVADAGELSFRYTCSADSAVSASFTGNVVQLEEMICRPIYTFIPETDPAIALELYADKTYTYTHFYKGVRETGSYSWNDGKLELTLPDDSTIASTAQGNLLKVTYTSVGGVSSHSFVGSLAVAGDVLPEDTIFTFTSGVNPAIMFRLYADGTYNFSWEENGVSEGGTWSFVNGVFSVTDPKGTVTQAKAEGDSLHFTYYYSVMSQLNQPYSCKIADFAKMLADNGIAQKCYAFTPGNSAITFELYTGGVYKFAHTQYNVAEYGIWSLKDGILNITDPTGKVTTSALSGDEMSFRYVYSAQSQLFQDYTGSLGALAGTLIGSGDILRLYAFTSKDNSTITFELYTGGIYKFAFPAYDMTEYGIWTLDKGIFTITDGAGKTTVAKTEGDEISFTYVSVASSLLFQDYTGSLKALMGILVSDNQAQKVYAFTPEDNNAIIFELYEKGIYKFAHTDYNMAEYGTWSLKDGILTITDPTGKVTTSALDGDEMSFRYVYSAQSQLFQDYTGSLSALTQALDGE